MECRAVVMIPIQRTASLPRGACRTAAESRRDRAIPPRAARRRDRTPGRTRLPPTSRAGRTGRGVDWVKRSVAVRPPTCTARRSPPRSNATARRPAGTARTAARARSAASYPARPTGAGARTPAPLAARSFAIRRARRARVEARAAVRGGARFLTACEPRARAASRVTRCAAGCRCRRRSCGRFRS
jgi:hypothetical protein